MVHRLTDWSSPFTIRVTHPLLYEINTRCWLNELSERHRRPVTLATVPDEEFAQWQRLGFTHIWLMGVWTTGPKCRALALAEPNLRRAYDEILPGWRDEDVGGSPYAIGSYEVPAALGGEPGLADFCRKLHAHGLKLVLDFVPNHLGLDHRWLRERPDLFVQSPVEASGTFLQDTVTGSRWLAHGKDPYFPPWNDTVQLDYRRAATREAMLGLLQSVAARCDGVRCDVAMLLLNEVFARTWESFPVAGETPLCEFWADAIAAIRRNHPDFLFLAEVYWDLEARLHDLGFDFAYDKHLYDELFWRNAAGAQRRLLDAGPGFVARCAHFLENHDEPRIATQLSTEEHRAAALVILGLPGMRFLHEGQLAGARVKLPVQLARRRAEAADPAVAALYEALLAALPHTAVGKGHAELLTPRPAWRDNPSGVNFVLAQWQATPPAFDLVAVNLAPHRSQCYAPVTVRGLERSGWRMSDHLGHEQRDQSGNALAAEGVYLDLPAHGAQLLHFEPRF